MATWLPAAYASIPEDQREEYFLDLDEAVTEADRGPGTLFEAAGQPGTDHREYMAQMNMSHLMAEEAVLAEMVLLPPEQTSLVEAGDLEIDRSGAYLDAGWQSPRVELSSQEWEAQRTSADWKPLALNTTPRATAVPLRQPRRRQSAGTNGGPHQPMT